MENQNSARAVWGVKQLTSKGVKYDTFDWKLRIYYQYLCISLKKAKEYDI